MLTWPCELGHINLVMLTWPY